jgi:zinc transporter ZupT
MRTFREVLFVIILLLCLVRAEDDDHDDHDHEEEEEMMTEAQIWGFGFLGGLAVSLIGFIAAIIVVLIKRCGSDGCFEVVIKFLFALACGALLGDVVVHIFPEAYNS